MKKCHMVLAYDAPYRSTRMKLERVFIQGARSIMNYFSQKVLCTSIIARVHFVKIRTKNVMFVAETTPWKHCFIDEDWFDSMRSW